MRSPVIISRLICCLASGFVPNAPSALCVFYITMLQCSFTLLKADGMYAAKSIGSAWQVMPSGGDMQGYLLFASARRVDARPHNAQDVEILLQTTPGVSSFMP